jgi:hypothetical protein
MRAVGLLVALTAAMPADEYAAEHNCAFWNVTGAARRGS